MADSFDAVQIRACIKWTWIKWENLFCPFISLHCTHLWRTPYSLSMRGLLSDTQQSALCFPIDSNRVVRQQIWYCCSHGHIQSQFNYLHRKETQRGRQREKLRKNEKTEAAIGFLKFIIRSHDRLNKVEASFSKMLSPRLISSLNSYWVLWWCNRRDVVLKEQTRNGLTDLSVVIVQWQQTRAVCTRPGICTLTDFSLIHNNLECFAPTAASLQLS